MSNIWHPCTQMQDHLKFPPLKIDHARGSYLYLKDGTAIIDGISSWWCKTLGHNHPALKAALIAQADKFEHAMLANTTSEVAEQLSAKLAEISTGLDKVFYAGDGASAIEIAMKISLQAHAINNQPQKNQFAALKNDYHGDTSLALSVSDVGLFKQPFAAITRDYTFLQPMPYVNYVDNGKKLEQDSLWANCDNNWQQILPQLEASKSNLAAIVFEPIVQGAAGMKIYSQDLLTKLRAWATANNVYLIADEIMTGFGRTGLPLACQHAGIIPDFVCLSKGLTSGWLPFSAVLTSRAIFDLFVGDYASGKAFMHSHTYCGNALAASVALATLKTLEEEGIYQRVNNLSTQMHEMFTEVANSTGKINNVRGIGGIVAGELLIPDDRPRIGFEFSQIAAKLGALLRPSGNTVYWLPPLNIDILDLEKLQQITKRAIKELY